MTESRHAKIGRYLLAIALLATALYRAGSRPRFRPVQEGELVAPGWTFTSDETGYALTGPDGRSHRIELERSGDPRWTTLMRNTKPFLVTRYLGGGSSGATYYSVYRLDPGAPTRLSAAESRDWSDDDPDRCRESPKVESPPKDPAMVFGACPDPEWRTDALIFRMPGFHCSIFQLGGCPREDRVRLE